MQDHLAARLTTFAQAMCLRRVGEPELLAHQQAQPARINPLGQLRQHGAAWRSEHALIDFLVARMVV